MTRRTALTSAVAFAAMRWQGSGRASAAATLSIACSMPVLRDIVANIVSDVAEVFMIMPENADPHTWEASPEDLIRVGEADSFILIGAHLEPFVESGGWRRAVRDAGIAQLAIAEEIELIVVDQVIDHGDHVHDLRGGDPHFWLDPYKVIEAVPVIRDHLISLVPEHQDVLTNQADAYVSTLTDLGTRTETQLAEIPEERRKLIVFHDAWRYFAARFSFEVVGIVVSNPSVEVSAQELNEISRTIDHVGIDVIFTEPHLNTDVLELIADQQDVTVADLLTDSFAGRVSTYSELIEFNTTSLVTHLA